MASKLGNRDGINGEEFVEAARAALEPAAPHILADRMSLSELLASNHVQDLTFDQNRIAL